MNRRLADALETCIKSLQAGVTLEECLNQYPDVAPQLRDLLKTVEMIECLRVEKIPVESMTQNQRELLSHAKKLVSQEKPGKCVAVAGRILAFRSMIVQTFRQAKPIMGRLVMAFAITGILIIFSGSLLIVSAKSLPGDSLYPMKLAVENIRVHLAISGEIRSEYEDHYSQQRVLEVQSLLGLGRKQEISFEGILNSMEDTGWVVNGITVKLQPETVIMIGNNAIRSVEPGMKVEVDGITNEQGWVQAEEIHLREYHYFGIVDAKGIDGWEISGINVRVSSLTHIDSGVQVGNEAEVVIRAEDNGMFAMAILSVGQQKPGSAPPQSSTVDTKASEGDFAEDSEELQISGKVVRISPFSWTVDGVDVYIANDTHIADDIKLGDNITVIYEVEANGSFTALEIDKSRLSDQNDDTEMQPTPEPGGDDEGLSDMSDHPSEAEETEAYPNTPDHEETPVPTESELDPD